MTITAKRVRLWYRIHKWTSLICTLFLLSECLTGLPLVFGEEIFDLTHKHVHAANVPADAPLASLDGIVAAGKQMYPGLKILFVGFDDEEPRVFLDLSEKYDPKPGEDLLAIAARERAGRLKGNTIIRNARAQWERLRRTYSRSK